jgi:hypothetical protein
MKPQRKKRLVMMAKAPREALPLLLAGGVDWAEGRVAAIKKWVEII